MKNSEQLNELATALALAQGELEGVVKDSKVTVQGQKANYSYNFADLNSVIQTAKPIISAHGLSISQLPCNGPNGRTAVETILLHASGQYISGLFEAPEKATDEMKMGVMQSQGSLITYMRRYSYQAILGLATEDNDAQVGGQKTKAPTTNIYNDAQVGGQKTKAPTTNIYIIKEPRWNKEWTQEIKEKGFSCNSKKTEDGQWIGNGIRYIESSEEKTPELSFQPEYLNLNPAQFKEFLTYSSDDVFAILKKSSEEIEEKGIKVVK